MAQSLKEPALLHAISMKRVQLPCTFVNALDVTSLLLSVLFAEEGLEQRERGRPVTNRGHHLVILEHVATSFPPRPVLQWPRLHPLIVPCQVMIEHGIRGLELERSVCKSYA